mgnify:CR=1 FL=1
MSVLALDLGTSTGFALSVGEGALVFGTLDLRPKKYEGGGHRLLKLRAKLDEWHAIKALAHVYFEAVRRHIGTDAAHIYGGLMGEVESWCEAHGVPYAGVPVGTIKKGWVGKGNANKADMIAEAENRGFEVDNDNEADALALMWHVCPQAFGYVGEVRSVKEAAE